MENMEMLLEPIRTSLHQVGEFLPRVLLALAILRRRVAAREGGALRDREDAARGQLQRRHREGGRRQVPAAGRRASSTPTGVLGLLAYWLVILAALMIAFNSLGLAYVTDLLGRIVLFVPKVMVAVLILAFGAYFARFVGTAVTTYCRNVGIGDAEVLGRLALYAILVFVVLIALDQLGLGDIIRQTFLIVVGAVAVGLALGIALAFGLGGQRRAAELLERWSRRRDERAAGTETKPPAL